MPKETELTEQSQIETPFRAGFGIQKPEIPTEVKHATADDLASEYITFLETEFPELELTPYGQNFDLFLKSKYQIERWNLPLDVSAKIQKAEYLAKQRLLKQKAEERKKRLEKEKAELPSLASRCVDWAVTHNLKKVTQADVDAFVLEYDLEMLPETKRAIYSKVNLELKSK
jgi:hypothetical protein